MAGEWLKFEKATLDKPEVLAVAAAMQCDPDLVVGKLMRMWSWFDTHTENGNARGVTLALLDSILRVTGFAENVQKVGWLIVSSDGLKLPNFDRHCGETAKQRALTAKRVAGFKAGNGKGNASTVTSALPREEKRREEKKREQDQKKKQATKRAQTPVPENFTVSDRVKAWAAGKGFDRLDEHCESFRRKCTAKGYTYADWDSAFMEAIREDWAKLRVVNGSNRQPERAIDMPSPAGNRRLA